MRWALLLALLATPALASRADRISVSPRLDRRDRLGASSAASPILLSLSLLPPDSECSGAPPDGVTFTRASGATCIDSSGLAYNLTSNQARTHATLGLLVEGTATNAMLRSRATSTVPWSCPTCGATTLGMDGATSVPTIAAGTASQAISPAAGARIVSVYVRNAGGVGCSVTLSADAETTGAVSVFDLGAWQRVSLSYTSDAAVTVSLAVSGASCTAVAADYWQDEAGTIATSPVVSAGTAATRAGEVATVPLSGLAEAAGCAGITFAPMWTGAFPGVGNPSARLSARSGVPNSGLLNYNNPGVADWAAYDGTNPPVAAAAAFATGVPRASVTTWGAGSLSICDVPSSVCGSKSAAGWPAFDSVIRVGSSTGSGAGAAFGHLSNLVLGNAPGACQ